MPSLRRLATRCSFLVLCLSYAALGRAADLPTPASDVFSQWVQQQRGPGPGAFASPQAVATGLSLAQSRQQELKALLERDPAEFVRRAMPEAERAQLPAQLQPFVERRVKGRGSFEVYCAGLPTDEPAKETRAAHAGYVYEAQLSGVRYRAFVFGKWRDQKTVLEAGIEGVALDGSLALGDAPTPTEQFATGQSVSAYTPTTTGPNTLLYMIAQFSDQTSDPIDEATVLSQMGVVSNFWMNCSGGNVYIHGLIHATQVVDIVHIKLPSPASSYINNFALLISNARTAASALNYNYANYNLDVVVTSNSGFGYAGQSYIGAQGSHWVAGYTSLRTAGHELGHNLGLYHANYWRTDSTQPFGKDSNPGGYVADNSNGEWVEYGHYFSVMSAQFGEMDDATKPIYNPVEKVQLGWLSGSQVQYVTASGTYRLFRDDARTTVGTPRGIRIETPATDYSGYGRRYWLQYRYAPWNTALNWFQNGIEVDVASTGYGSDGSILLDMTPYSNDQSSPFYDANSKPGSWWTIDNNDKIDGALIVGRSFEDTGAGIHVTPLRTGSNGTGEEYIDVAINLGAFGTNHPPVINSFTASTNQVAAGQSVNFNVAASDPDGDTLAYSWDFDEVQVWTASGLNSAAATRSWSNPGQYRVVVRVSDMKGGVATASQIITVGAPANTGEIWGRVVWGGQPVYGALVSTAAGEQAWTDTDGSYVLTDLIPGSAYTVNCIAAGLTFTAQFSNPVSLAGGIAFGADFYANQPLGGSGAGLAVSGQVTDPVNGVAGVEVRGGGMVATTDFSGNYQLTNFLNGTYTLVPRNPLWTFSPASRSVTVSSANSTGNNFSRVAPYSITGNVNGLPTSGNSSPPTVYLSNGRSVVAIKAGTGGNRFWSYTLNNVPAGQYSVSAFLYGYSIVPSGFSNPLTISANASGVNFNGTASANVAGAISGSITQYGVPLAGVNVSALQGSSTIGSAFTDSDGAYRIDNLPTGSYTVSASKTGYSFSPTSLSVGSVPSSGNNFAATGSISPPTISSVSANPSLVPAGTGSTVLSAVASGSGTLTYSWDALLAPAPVTFSPNDSNGAGSTTVSVQAPGLYTFRARVTDPNGFSATKTVNVTVSAGPGAMVVSPYEAQVPGGQTVAFRADAWDQLGNRITVSPTWSASGGGSVDATGLFTAVTAGGPFTIMATSGGLSATGLVWVTSSAGAMPPSITAQPLSEAEPVGSNASFNVGASGTGPLIYQWLLNGGPIGGATTSSYTRTNVQTGDAGNYSVLVTNLAGVATSSNAVLSVIVPPVITAQPLGQAVPVGSNGNFSVGVSGTGPLSYQWLLNGSAIAGANASSYTRASVQTGDAGNYSVQVTNLAGVATSSNAVLSVIVPPVITAQPLSRAVAAGSNVIFTVTASGTMPLGYQWQFEGSALSGATTSIYTKTNAQSGDAGNYTVTVTNLGGGTTSAPAVLTVNNPPTLRTAGDRTIHAGGIVVVTNTAIDPDLPPQTLSFSLDGGAPAGATLNATNGVFAWTSSLASAGSTNLIMVRVTDSGRPSLSDAKSFLISVIAPLTLQSITATNSSATITWNAVPGGIYRVQYKDNSSDSAWKTLGPDIVATGPTASLTDPIGASQRFYRVLAPE